MTPEQKLKHLVLLKSVDLGAPPLPDGVNAETIDDLYDERYEEDGGELQDARSEVRCSGEETDIAAPFSRHYESDSHAAQYLDGSWVGWTYWYGGGKHGEPEAIDWMNDAYGLTCEEKQVMVTQRTFTKPT
ncbi:MAG: hypothetical protein PHU77_00315 [Simplicispira sp.]|nr:hypothetical protein [Simplicispira sp.]